MDVKSAFLYGTIDEEVYVSQPPVDTEEEPFTKLFIKKDKNDIMLVQVYVDDIIFGSTKKSWCDDFEALMKSRFQMSSMGELTFFLGLQVKQKEDGIFISQDKYVAEILKKFDFASVKIASTLIKTQKPLTKDEEADDVDVTPKTSQLHAVKRIFRYLKGHFHNKGCQFLSKLISWQCKKQTIVATSTIEAEYVAAANCCGQHNMHCKESSVSLQNKAFEIRYHFIRDAYEKKLIQVLKIHTDDNVADLLTKAFNVSRFNFLIVNIGMLNLYCSSSGKACCCIIIEDRFSDNDEFKKMHKYILKQQFESFSVSNSEGLHKGYDRSLPTSWSQVSLIMRTKLGVDTFSFDDLYNNLRVFESDIKGSTTSPSSTHNVAFVSSESTNSTNDVSTAYDHEDLKQVDAFDLEEMDLKWQVTMISMRLKKFYKKTGRRLQFDAKEPVGFDKTKEPKALVTLDGDGVDWTGHAEDKQENFALMAHSNSGSNTKMSTRDKSGLGYGNQIHEGVLSYEKEVLQSVFDSRSSDVEDNPVNDRFAKVKEMHAVPPPMTRIYMPSKSDFGIDESKFTYGPKQSKTIESDDKTSDNASCELNSSVETPNFLPKTAVNEPTTVSKSEVWSDAPIIEEYESDTCKNPRETVKEQKTYSLSPKANKRDWNSLMSKKLGLGYGFTKNACFVYGSFSHLIRDCDFHEKRMAKLVKLNKQKGKGTGQGETRPVWNIVQRLSHQNKFVPKAVLTKTSIFPVNAARQNPSSQAAETSTARNVNTARPIRDLKTFLKLVPDEEGIIDYEVLEKRFPIINWESKFYHLDRHGAECIYYRIFRSDESSRWIKTFSEMVTMFDRLDLEELYNLKMNSGRIKKDGILRAGISMRIVEFIPLILEDGTEIHMLAERKYPLTKETLERMMSLKLIAESASESAYNLLRFIQKQIDEYGSYDGSEKDL
ncbi:ribonuclease H-like domain-containing protein [Tanacetum coccineum]